MSRTLVSFSVLLAAAFSSIATSPPLWTVHADDKGTFRVDRGDALELEIDLFATAAALPEVEAGFAPQGGSGEGGLQTGLELVLDIRTQGTLGFGRTETQVVAELWMDTPEGDWLVDDVELDIEAGPAHEVLLSADGVFASCEPGLDCERSLSIVLVQSDDAKLKVAVDADLDVRAPLMGPAPDTAEVDVEVTRL